MRYTCRYPGESQFLITTDAPALSLVGAPEREVGRTELVGDFFTTLSSSCHLWAEDL